MKKKSKKVKKAKAIVLLSGGLDSRLVVKMLQEQRIKIIALFFLFPFGSGCCMPHCAFNFAQIQNIKLRVIDCSKGTLFKEYLEIVKNPKHGYGTAINPCIDCRIFMLKKAKQLMKKTKADFIATGEVLNERPMSQTRQKMNLIELESGLQGRILRPLSAKLLDETEVEKKGLVDRTKLFAIQGRRRIQQMELAKKYKLTYPTPAGGCLLCEKEFAKKMRDLFKHKQDIKERDVELLKVGRHFRVGDSKIIVGRNEKENKKIIELADNDWLFEPKDVPGPTSLLEKPTQKTIKIAAALTVSFSDARNKKNVEIIYGKGKLNKSLKINPLNKKEIEKYKIK